MPDRKLTLSVPNDELIIDLIPGSDKPVHESVKVPALVQFHLKGHDGTVTQYFTSAEVRELADILRMAALALDKEQFGFKYHIVEP